ncbi:MAG: S8 family serine peptidase [Pirellulales bacterium]|nr:S8 family serine peptidase [Pirellulales bacterium]
MKMKPTCNRSYFLLLVAWSIFVIDPPSVQAIDTSIPAIHADVSRNLLGDGTGAILGIIDSGVDDTHPALAGVDSLGNPRLVAEANFVPIEPGNTGDDVYGHGTWVSSAALSRDSIYPGMAPDARFVNARVLDSSNSFSTRSWVQNGVGFAIEQGANILNLSLNYYAANNSGSDPLDKMLDWAAYERGILVAVAAGNIGGGDGTSQVRSPGSLYNGFSVGRTDADFDQVHSDSATATTSDGRAKPDLVAPGTQLTLANDDWETGGAWDCCLSGTSFSSPHVAGLMAQQLEYGNLHNMSTNPLVFRATIVNSTVPVLNKQGVDWTPAEASQNGGVFEVTQPLDAHSGAGQIDGVRLFSQYAAGEQAPGSVDPIGWDLGTITSVNSLDYEIDQDLRGGTELTASLTWYRHVTRTNYGSPGVDASDLFSVNEALDNLDLEILLNGNPIARSISVVDNLEFLRILLPGTGHVTIRVHRQNVANSGPGELFGLAWCGVVIPEPGTLVLGLLLLVGSQFRGRSNPCPF